MVSELNDEAAGVPLPQRLRHVYWIGGASGAGKSTIARRIADRYGMRLYATDEAMADHARRMPAASAPHLREFAAMDMDERWVNRTPGEMLDTFHWFHGEGFEHVVEDLLLLPADRPVVAEGFRLLPDLVQPLLADPGHAVWLLPVPEFRHAVFAARGGREWGFLARTSDPQRALQNLLDRDAMFTDRLAVQVRRLGLTAFTVDATVAEEDLVRRVVSGFGLGR